MEHDKVITVQIDCLMPMQNIIAFRKDLLKQMEEGIIVIPPWAHVAHVGDECEIEVKEMKPRELIKEKASDVLTVSFDSGLGDETGLCVARKLIESTIVLKTEIGEQADILYRLLTEQETKAEIKKGEEE